MSEGGPWHLAGSPQSLPIWDAGLRSGSSMGSLGLEPMGIRSSH